MEHPLREAAHIAEQRPRPLRAALRGRWPLHLEEADAAGRRCHPERRGELLLPDALVGDLKRHVFSLGGGVILDTGCFIAKPVLVFLYI